MQRQHPDPAKAVGARLRLLSDRPLLLRQDPLELHVSVRFYFDCAPRAHSGCVPCGKACFSLTDPIPGNGTCSKSHERPPAIPDFPALTVSPVILPVYLLICVGNFGRATKIAPPPLL